MRDATIHEALRPGPRATLLFVAHRVPVPPEVQDAVRELAAHPERARVMSREELDHWCETGEWPEWLGSSPLDPATEPVSNAPALPAVPIAVLSQYKPGTP
jgi:hypothetical protein